MSALGLASSCRSRIETLVHPAAASDDVERTRHALFLMTHLGVSLIAFAAFPLRLAAGVPGSLELAAWLALQAPLTAAVLAMRGAALRIGYAVCCAGFLAFAGLLAFAANHAPAVSTAMALLALGVAPLTGYTALIAWSGARLELLRRAQMDREAARHRALMQACGDLALELDRRGAVLSCSADGGSGFALTPRELSGPGLFERIHLGDRPAFLQALSDAFEACPGSALVLRLRTANVPSARGDFCEPVYTTVEARLRAVGARAGAAPIAVCLLRDITAQHARESEIRDAQKLAERAEATRERFVANVSHELRTPLNAIIGFADLLRLESVPKDDATRAEYAQIIAASGQHLLSIVNSILDMSKLESGSLEIEPTRFDPATLLDGCLDIVRLKAVETGVTLVRRYDAALAPILADERACRQIVINLLSNAVKFTARGGTVVLAASSDFGLSVCVEDTGIGIAASDLPRLGDAFFQASNARSRLYEGTGLGLSLVRGLVGLHGGTIDIESAPGNGTTVTVSLPADCRASTSMRTPVTIHTIPRQSSVPVTLSRQSKVQNVA